MQLSIIVSVQKSLTQNTRRGENTTQEIEEEIPTNNPQLQKIDDLVKAGKCVEAAKEIYAYLDNQKKEGIET